MKRLSTLIAIILLLLLPVVLVWSRLRPITMVRVYSPSATHQRYIQIVEVPRIGSMSSLIISLLDRGDPLYRFELHDPDGYLWAAATYNSSSYKPHKASVTWKSSGEAFTYLDEMPQFRMIGDLWEEMK